MNTPCLSHIIALHYVTVQITVNSACLFLDFFLCISTTHGCLLMCGFLLQGFVKIARWSEMNYWALKESTEKTHRTVHKHARAFQVCITSVSTMLYDLATVVHMHTPTHTCKCIFLCIPTNTKMCICPHMHVHKHTYTLTWTHMHTHSHTHTHTHTHRHTHIQTVLHAGKHFCFPLHSC